ncbi:phosphoribosyl-ATP pyrophosphatase [Polynucleobacter sp. SHI8]|nr:phosphoribosyl-ATP pyrophosphatase [Polynucleobacter sp. SHI2]BDW12485.1 phosphoribosyl-ATP pyrophosphatase [Polynucleobacter sp. SHI8]
MSNTQEDLNEVLKNLADVIASRKKQVQDGSNTEDSYVASLFKKGDDAILKKIGEEASETIMAAKDARYAMTQGSTDCPQALVNEVADLWFHCIVLLAQFNLRPEDVLQELHRREGVSGIAEKAARPK